MVLFTTNCPQKAYPNTQWIDGNFLKVSTNTWKDQEKTRQHMDYLASVLGVSKPEDWYRVSTAQISAAGGWGCVTYFGRLSSALRFAYPEHQWDTSLFMVHGKRSVQRFEQIVCT